MTPSKQIRLAFSLLLFLAAEKTQVLGQELIWEKKIPLSTYESFGCVAKCSDGGYLAFGSSGKWLWLNPVVDGAILMRFNADGDTLWTKWTGKYGGFNKVIKGEDGLFYALMAYEDTTTNKTVWCIYVVTEDGVPFTTIPLNPGDNATLTDMEYHHGCFWLSGEKMPSIFFPAGFSFDFLLMKVRYDGSEVFSYPYNGGDQTSRGQKMEFMPNGNILFSGSVGNKIGAFEIDTAGNQIQYRTYFTNTFNGAWLNPTVTQASDGNRLVAGNRNTNPNSYFMGKIDTSGNRIWGGISEGGSGAPMVFNDGTLVHLYGKSNPPTSLVRRLSPDSVLLSTFNFMGPGMIQAYKSINDIYYEADSSGVAVGMTYPTSFSPVNLYICKFGGLGIPYNPTSAQSFEKLKTDAQPLAFPNPGTDVVKFTMLAGPGKVSLTDVQGRKVYDGEYMPEKGIATKSFTPGLYTWRLERNGKLWTGKWVKE